MAELQTDAVIVAGALIVALGVAGIVAVVVGIVRERRENRP